jgi:hypothetical protein
MSSHNGLPEKLFNFQLKLGRHFGPFLYRKVLNFIGMKLGDMIKHFVNCLGAAFAFCLKRAYIVSKVPATQ